MKNKAHGRAVIESTDVLPREESMDFIVENHGSIVLLRPTSDAGREWIEENIGADNGYQPYFPTVVCEPRYVGDIVAGIQNDGLRVR